jgi:hypothetical protein
MKKFNYCLLLVLGLVFGGQPVSAATYEAFDYTSDQNIVLDAPNSINVSIDYLFQSNWQINSASFWLYAADDENDPPSEQSKVVSIESSGFNSGNTNINGGTTANWYNLNVDILNYLLSPHTSPFTATIKAQAGDFKFINAKIVVDYTVVPVPAAVWLFGSALLGLMGFTHRKRHVQFSNTINAN